MAEFLQGSRVTGRKVILEEKLREDPHPYNSFPPGDPFQTTPPYHIPVYSSPHFVPSLLPLLPFGPVAGVLMTSCVKSMGYLEAYASLIINPGITYYV